MRVLFYLNPGMLPQGPSFNGGWTTLLGELAATLAASGRAECRLVTGTRFRALVEHLQPAVGVAFIDEVALQRDVHARFGPEATPSYLASLCGLRGRPAALAPLCERVAETCAGFEPDLVVTFSLAADYLRTLWPAAAIAYVETGAFSRAPYPATLFFDHIGLYGTAATAHVSPGVNAPEPSAEARAFVHDYRAHVNQALARESPFGALDLHRRFPRVVLLPLQVSNWHSFDDQVRYRTQYEYLFDVASAAPRDVGLLVVEYGQWGPVLDTHGPAANWEYLRATFPNLVWLPTARKYFSPSQYLVRHVHGVFAVSSNVGYQALLLGKRLGTPPRSSLAAVAHDADAASFFRNLQADAVPADRIDFLAWYLERYLVPEDVYRTPAALADYLERRLAALRAGREPYDAFVPVADLAALRGAWFRDAARSAADPLNTHAQLQVRARARADVELARQQSRALRAPARSPAGTPRYVLLNDTEVIDHHLHLGCNAVTRYLHARAATLGFECLGTANDREGARGLQSAADGEPVRLAIFNAEGSLHHDSPRCAELMDFARELKAKGACCVLVNAVWHANGASLGERLDAFDLVAVRDSRSLAEIRRWRADAIQVADLAFAAFADPGLGFAEDAGAPALAPGGIRVIDSVIPDATRALRQLAEFHGWPFFFMGRLGARVLDEPVDAAYDVDGIAFPRILRRASDLAGAQGCVTGRFHGVVAALVARVPVVAVPSNTPKIEGLLEDCGLGERGLLPASWLSEGLFHRRDLAEARLAQWGDADRTRVEAHVATAQRDIDGLFASIGELASRARPEPARRRVPRAAR